MRAPDARSEGLAYPATVRLGECTLRAGWHFQADSYAVVAVQNSHSQKASQTLP